MVQTRNRDKLPKNIYVRQGTNILWINVPQAVVKVLYPNTPDARKRFSSGLAYLDREGNVIRENILQLESGLLELTRDCKLGKLILSEDENNRLAKYLPSTAVYELPDMPKSKPEMTVGELWDFYYNFKKDSLKENTRSSYRRLRKKLERCNLDELQLCPDIGIQVREVLLDKYDDNQGTKRILAILSRAVNQACNYGKSHLIKDPFFKLGDDLKVPKRTNLVTGESDSMVSLTWEDAEKVISAYFNRIERANSAMAYLVAFKFLTGCRTNEALPLCWSDIDWDKGVVTFDKVKPQYSNKPEKTLKNAEKRTVPICDRLLDLLKKWKIDCPTDSLVFPSTRKTMISQGTLSESWAGKASRQKGGIVKELAIKGEIDEYIVPYNTRHTYINELVRRGYSLDIISRLCGTSASTIAQAYIDKHRLEVPRIQF